uniref:Uncharacterized protein n=1 Tax=Arundo donax TaxID=35708 RepID=A0A0A9CRF2_ARUDO
MEQDRRRPHHARLPRPTGLRADAARRAAEPQQPEQLPLRSAHGAGAQPHAEHQAPEPEQWGVRAGGGAIDPAAAKAAAGGEGKGAGAGIRA